MADGKRIVDPVLSGFYEAMERINAEKIAHETLAGISEDSSDSGGFDIESESEDVTPRIFLQLNFFFLFFTRQNSGVTFSFPFSLR
jgi:hypothetical protein